MKNFWKKTLPYVAIALVYSLIGAGITLSLGSTNGATAQAEAAQLATKMEGVVSSPFTEAVKVVKDSVVGVNNYQRLSTSYSGSNYYKDPFGFFGYGTSRGGNLPQQSTEKVKASSGSGVAISDQGHIITNYHVVEKAESLTISIGDQEYDAILIASDQALDIAIIQAKDVRLNPVSLGNSDTLQVGEWAIAIGNPLTTLNESFSGTTTVGVISGLNRSVTSDVTDEYGRIYENTNSTMIQVDAAINSGNSGGGLFNVLGELVGIPTIKYSGRLGNNAYIDGIGMCIAINDAKPLIDKVLSGEIQAPQENEKVEEGNPAPTPAVAKPRLGITVGRLNQNNALVQSGKVPTGILIHAVEENSPAQKAGLLVDDIIVEANDTRITQTTDLTGVIEQLNAGDTVNIKVFRLNNSLAESENIGEYIDIPVVLEMIE